MSDEATPMPDNANNGPDANQPLVEPTLSAEDVPAPPQPAATPSAASTPAPDVAPPPAYPAPTPPGAVPPGVPPYGGYMPPPGYAPYGGAMPPPNYPPPFAGNVPPGAVPPGYPPPFAGNVPPGAVPPGYPPPGTVPPGYPPQFYVPIEFPPPPAYAVPSPYVGFPWEIIPPAPGGFVAAWFAIIPNIARRNIAARAQIIPPNGTTWSIGVGLVLAAIAGVINGIRIIDFTNQTASAATAQVFQGILTGEGVATIILTPLALIVNVFVIPWFWSFFMSPYLGTPRQRFQRAFRPFALIQPIIGALALIEAIVALLVYVLLPVFAILSTVIVLPLLVYSTALNIQTGSVAAGLKRWPIFGINLLASLAVGFATALIAIIAIFVGIALHVG